MVLGPALVLGLGIAPSSRGSRVRRCWRCWGGLRADGARQGPGAPQVIWPHALKNALLPVITRDRATCRRCWRVGGGRDGVLGARIGHGAGPGAQQRDWTMIQNLVLLYGVMFTLVNLLVDLSYRWFDPRIRYV